MRRAKKVKRSAVAGDTACPLATETVLATIGGVATQSADGQVNIDGWAQVTGAAGSTTTTLRVRRGTDATGALVGEGNAETHAASAIVERSISVQDVPGEGTFSYVVTATCAGAAGTANQAAATATY